MIINLSRLQIKDILKNKIIVLITNVFIGSKENVFFVDDEKKLSAAAELIFFTKIKRYTTACKKYRNLSIIKTKGIGGPCYIYHIQKVKKIAKKGSLFGEKNAKIF